MDGTIRRSLALGQAPARRAHLSPPLPGSPADRPRARVRRVLRGWNHRDADRPVRGGADRLPESPLGAERQDSRDTDCEPGDDSVGASRSSACATRSTSSRVSASSSLRAASSTAWALAASGARTRSLTVVSVISAMRRSRGSDGVVTPRSHRETVIDSTPSASASCLWVSPALRRAVRSRPPTPPLSWVLKAKCPYYHTRRCRRPRACRN